MLRLAPESNVNERLVAQVESLVALIENVLRLVLECRAIVIQIVVRVKPAVIWVKTPLEPVINSVLENHVKTCHGTYGHGTQGTVTVPWANTVVDLIKNAIKVVMEKIACPTMIAERLELVVIALKVVVNVPLFVMEKRVNMIQTAQLLNIVVA